MNSQAPFAAEGLALHPTSPTTVFAAGSSGLWQSVDGGANWQRLGNSSTARGVVVDPSSPDTLYTYAFAPWAVMKSTNGGATWAAAATGLNSINQVQVNAMAIDPTNPARLYAALGNAGGVFRSLDGAATWQRVAFEGFTANDIAIDPRGTTAVYAVANGRARRSADGGNTWLDVHAGIAGTAFRLAVEPTSGVVYVGTFDGSVFVSSNGGATWVRHAASPSLQIVNVLAADPTQPGVIYAANLYEPIQERQWFADLGPRGRRSREPRGRRVARQPRGASGGVRGDRFRVVQDH